MKQIVSKFYIFLGLVILILTSISILAGLSCAQFINISVDKSECFVFEEVNINVSIIPNPNGGYVYISLAQVNGSDELLFSQQPGCRACGAFKPPLTSETLKKFKKNFTYPGVYKVWGEISDANTYKRNLSEVTILVKEKNKNPDNSGNADNASDKKEIETETIETNTSAANISNTSNTLNIYFFYGENCSKCRSIEPLINEMRLKYNASFKFYEVFGNLKNEILLEDFSERYCIPKEKIEVPSIFIGNTSLIGEKEIAEKIEEKIIFFIDKNATDPIYLNKTCSTENISKNIPEKTTNTTKTIEKTDDTMQPQIMATIAIVIITTIIVFVLLLKHYKEKKG